MSCRAHNRISSCFPIISIDSSGKAIAKGRRRQEQTWLRQNEGECMTVQSGGALVLFSGGQDSSTCLAWALERFSRVETIGFDYRQRHVVELTCRGKIREALKTQFPTWSKR